VGESWVNEEAEKGGWRIPGKKSVEKKGGPIGKIYKRGK